jgi:hypothetical protein
MVEIQLMHVVHMLCVYLPQAAEAHIRCCVCLPRTRAAFNLTVESALGSQYVAAVEVAVSCIFDVSKPSLHMHHLSLYSRCFGRT